MIKDKTIFITGGSGFIASNLAKRLLENNRVVAFDNGRRNALEYLNIKNHENFTLVEGDVLDLDAVEKAMKGCNIVIHTAAIAGVSSYYEQPIKTMEVNFLGTSNVLKAAVKSNAEFFINFSTSEVYGMEALNVSEETETKQGPVGDARWTYSLSKIAAEQLCFAYSAEKQLSLTSLRPFNVYGPAQVGVGALNKFCSLAVKNEKLEITGDGSQVRAWCYIDDIIEAILLCLEKQDKAKGKVFNIGNHDAKVTILELAKQIIEISGSKSETVFTKHIGTDIQLRVPSVERAKKILGFNPKTNLKDGIKKTLEWYRKTGL